MIRLFKSPKHPLSELSDAELVYEYQQSGEGVYVGELYKRYTHLVYGICLKYLKNREDSQDAVMEIFEDLMNTLLRTEVQNFQSWLLTIAKNHCLMRLRSRKSLFSQYLQYKADAVSFMELIDEVHPNGGLQHEQDVQKLESALRQLKDEQKTCIIMFYYRGKSYQEISDNSGYELQKVKSYIQNGKRNLYNLLSELREQ